jgi:molecular chaperone GrpE
MKKRISKKQLSSDVEVPIDSVKYKLLAEEYLAGWKRCQADMANAKQNEIRNKNEYITYAEERIILELLPIVDIFDRAFLGQDASNPYVQGFRHIHTSLLQVLRTHNVIPISAIGKPFDVSKHEALDTVTVDNRDDDNKVIEELSRGYLLHEKVIQTSKVKVGVYKNQKNI